jgi:hypothetical protein
MTAFHPKAVVELKSRQRTASDPDQPFAKANTLVRNALFYLGLATLFTHELDAIANHEWRIMPLLRSFPEEVGFTTFVLLHIPIFAVLIALVSSSNGRVRTLSRVGVGVFLLAHAGLHVLFAGEAGYEFSSSLSNILIFGGALVGGLYLAASHRDIYPSQ